MKGAFASPLERKEKNGEKKLSFGAGGKRSPLVSKQTWCLTSTATIRLIKDGEKGERGYGGPVN